ncbi:UNVERIFIED_CONTAM: hypothetical protein GTU68_030818 [Idotea baltica]|nr:hypothetical protein [Idotea baltica]
MPHVILSQARVHDFYLEKMHNSTHQLMPDYNRELVEISRVENNEFPLVASLKNLSESNKTEVINAKYIVGCDGARSTVRHSIGQQLKGESTRQLWGVMDVLAVTDFPDIRKKSAIQSAEQGSLLIIPREGGYLVRMYIELSELHGDERASDINVSPSLLADKARDILSPYTLNVKQVVWWSAYEIGQRVCEAFDNVQREYKDAITPDIFITGDACHTHSPKAGQGMNVGMADAFNLGWKLAAVIRGQAKPALLHSYSEERSPVVKFTPSDSDIDSVIDVRAVFQANHRALAIDTMPSMLLPQKGALSLIDYEKVFCTRASQDIYDTRSIDRKQGALIIVRPDQYIACVLPLNDYNGLADYFDRIMITA